MFIMLKETIKVIVEYGERWQECIEDEDSFSALFFFFIAPEFIFFIIIAFIGDIVFFPFETIIYLMVRKARNERNK